MSLKLPGGERAIVPDDKLYKYLLSREHAHGASHAYKLRTLLGIDEHEGERLGAAQLKAAMNGEAVPGRASEYGRKYESASRWTGRGGRIPF